MEELKRLARVRYTLNEQERQDLNKKLTFTVSAMTEAERLHTEMQIKERQLFSEGAVLDSQIQEAKAQTEEYGLKLTDLCKQVPILFMENIGQSLTALKHFAF